MDDSIILWIFGSIITVVAGVVVYILTELRDFRKRFNVKNDEVGVILNRIEVDAKGVSEMVIASEKSQTEVKSTVKEVQRTLTRLAKELNQLLGQLSKD